MIHALALIGVIGAGVVVAGIAAGFVLTIAVAVKALSRQ